jgi:hypothetical protein
MNANAVSMIQTIAKKPAGIKIPMMEIAVSLYKEIWHVPAESLQLA